MWVFDPDFAVSNRAFVPTLSSSITVSLLFFACKYLIFAGTISLVVLRSLPGLGPAGHQSCSSLSRRLRLKLVIQAYRIQAQSLLVLRPRGFQMHLRGGMILTPEPRTWTKSLRTQSLLAMMPGGSKSRILDQTQCLDSPSPKPASNHRPGFLPT